MKVTNYLSLSLSHFHFNLSLALTCSPPLSHTPALAHDTKLDLLPAQILALSLFLSLSLSFSLKRVVIVIREDDFTS